MLLTPDESTLVQRFRALSDEQRSAILHTLLALNVKAVEQGTHPRVRERKPDSDKP